jgi:transposase-like protein
MGEEDEMKRRHHTPEQIVHKLREADRLLGEGSSMVVVYKHLEVTDQTYYRWRNQYGGMKAGDAKQLKEIERENSQLKKTVANQALDIDMLKEVNRGNF